jgi:precorrin-6A/cobalt-precorrin-6A reductase
MAQNLLILGGTTEASQLARAVADRGIPAILSYAGRVANPRAQPLPTRVGGFGGVDGLARYLRDHNITHLIDATHPFAAQMSSNADAAAKMASIPLAALTRPPWQAIDGDNWTHVPDIPAAAKALAGAPRRVMLALGRLHLAEFTKQSQHHYLLRLVDEPEDLPLPSCTVIVARGPFDIEGDTALLRDHNIDVVVSKNAGGAGAEAKIHAARALNIPMIMIDRPALPERTEIATVAGIFDWLDHAGTDRGV